ncbi:hypothetical protein E2C01_093284 [Portunus trituberculatus]|uniref:Uncharacterized protein n=1 Tax=Portunus trituberculatus TaxID=210409 RepID=A0A5B7JY59_PORTR|nr:hypothetical protein [Portunus trituberculatus]
MERFDSDDPRPSGGDSAKELMEKNEEKKRERRMRRTRKRRTVWFVRCSDVLNFPTSHKQNETHSAPGELRSTSYSRPKNINERGCSSSSSSMTSSVHP